MGSEIIVIPAIFIGLPWVVLHYITRWKTAATLTNADERLMEDIYALARRLEDRLGSVETIVTAADTNGRSPPVHPLHAGIEDRSHDNPRRIK